MVTMRKLIQLYLILRQLAANNIRLCLTIIVLVSYQDTFAQSVDLSKLRWAPEWTFTKPYMLTKNFRDYYSLGIEMEKHFQSKYANDASIEVLDTTDYSKELFRLKLKGGIIFSFTTDPGVFEIRTTPLTLKQWRSNQKLFQSVIFDTMAEIGLTPHEREGAGHLNFSLEDLRDRPLLIRNFIVDFYNHPGLGVTLNSLTANEEDAPYLDQLREKKRIKLLSIFKNTSSQNTTYRNILNEFSSMSEEKFIALMIRDIDEILRRRVEIRTLRPQKNMEQFIQLIEIFQARLEFLQHFDGVVPVKTVRPVDDGWKALGQWAQYIEETGLDPKIYRSLLPEAWQALDFQSFKRPRPSLPSRSCRKSVSK